MPSTMPSTALMSVSASPDNPFASRTWHVAVYLAEALSLAPSQYELRSMLSSARQPLGTTISPRSAGGEGSVCCGRMAHFVVNINNTEQALRARLNITSGAVRAVYLKAGSAPVYPDDVDGPNCLGTCAVTWYVSYDRYTGLRRFASANTSVVPTGGNLPDLRVAGEWYVSVQDMGLHERTDFELVIDAVTPPVPAAFVICDRYGRFDCANDIWTVPPDLYSSAVSRASPTPLALSAALLLIAARLSSWLGTRATSRRAREGRCGRSEYHG